MRTSTASPSAEATVFELAGGLGNQLFQYTAGLAYNAKTGHPVVFDTSVIERATNRQGRITESFNLSGNFVNLSKEFSPGRYAFLRIVAQTSKRLPNSGKRLGLDRFAYVSSDTGIDPYLFALPAGTFVRGYFQSHVYLDLLREKQLWCDLELRNPSPWYHEQSLKIRAAKPNAIHLRRGDYINLGHLYGLLGAAYYDAVLANLSSSNGGSGWVIFSDSTMAAEDLKKDCPSLADAEVVTPPPNSDPAESLILLSLCSTKAIANSTFSFWGAALGDPAARVIAPRPWYKGLTDPVSLLPSTWKRTQSTWL